MTMNGGGYIEPRGPPINWLWTWWHDASNWYVGSGVGLIQTSSTQQKMDWRNITFGKAQGFQTDGITFWHSYSASNPPYIQELHVWFCFLAHCYVTGDRDTLPEIAFIFIHAANPLTNIAEDRSMGWSNADVFSYPFGSNVKVFPRCWSFCNL